LVVAGSGPAESELHGTDRKGWLEATELRRMLRKARALIFPSRWQEPFGMLGIEALAEGTPVVVVESGGTNDWSETGCTVVPQGDLPAMTVAIERLGDDPDTALRLGRAGQRAVKKRFSRALLEPRLQEIYRRIG
jgi:glycosyltransferase involved in cell wall biosynthesis